MKRKLNSKVLAVVVFGTIALVAAGFGIHRLMFGKTTDDLKRRASNAADEKKLDEAIKYYQQYLRYKPNDLNTLEKYGMFLDKNTESGVRGQAWPVFEKLLRQPDTPGVDRTEIRKALVSLIIDVGKNVEDFSQAEHHLYILDPDLDPKKAGRRIDRATYLERLGRPNKDAKLVSLLARAYQGEKKYQDAADVYAKAIELDPAQIDSYLQRALLLRDELNDPQQADAVADEMVSRNNESAKAYLARSQYRSSSLSKITNNAVKTTAIEAARKDVNEALEYHANEALKREANEASKLEASKLEADIVFQAALLELDAPGGEGDLERARTLLQQTIDHQETIKNNPKRADLYQLLAQVELRTGHEQEADRVLTRGVKQVPESNDLAWQLANVLISTGQRARAQAMIDHFRTKGFFKPLIDLLKARLEVADGQWQEGYDALWVEVVSSPDGQTRAKNVEDKTSSEKKPGSGLRTRLDRWPQAAILADMDLARCCRQLELIGEDAESYHSQEIAAYRRALVLDPTYSAARLSLAAAQAHQKGSGFNDALQTLQEDSSLDARLMAVRVLANEVLQHPPGRQRDWTEVNRQLDTIEKQLPDTRQVLLLRVEVDMAQNESDRALRRLETARVAHPDWIELWIAQAWVYQQTGRPNESIGLLDQAERQLGPRPELFLARVQFWTQRSDPNTRQALLNLVPRIETYPAERRMELTEVLAQALGRADANAEGLSLMKTVVKDQPKSVRAWAGLFDLAYRTGDDAQMEQAIDSLHRLQGESGTMWLYAEAGRFVAKARGGDKSGLKDARTRIEKIREDRPKWVQIPLLEAEIAEIEGNTEETIKALRRAVVELGERRLPSIRKLVQLLYSNKQYDEADQVIQNLEQQGDLLGTNLNRMASEVSLRSDPGRALQLADKAVSPDSKDFRDHVWLGQLRAAARQPAQAEQAFRKAIKLSSGAPEAYIALIQFYLRNGRKADAEQTLKQASEALPADQAALILARGYDLLGRNEEAQALFEKAIAAKPGDINTIRTATSYYLQQGRIDLAEPILRDLIDNPKTAQADRLWARRTLALGFVNSDTPSHLDEALALITANLDEAPDPRDEKRAKAYVLAARPGERGKAIEIFEEIEKNGPSEGLSPNDQLYLARLYEVTDNWPKANQWFKKLVADNPDNPNLLVTYLLSLTRRREFDEAAKRLAQLERLAPNTLQALVVESAVLKAQGKVDEAKQKVRGFAQANPKQSGSIAGLLEQLGDMDGAESLLVAWADQKDQPSNALALAAFYGRQNRLKEALDVCDGVRQSGAPLELVLSTAISVLATSQTSPELLRRVEGWIDVAERQPDQKEQYRNQRALLLALEGRVKEAEELYRKSLRTDPGDFLAMNNLAWQLALTGGDADEALTLINRAIAGLGQNPALLDTRAIVYLTHNKPDEAVADLKRALAARPNAVTYFHLARAQRATKDNKSAIETLKAAEALGLKSTDIDPLERMIYNEVIADLHAQAESSSAEGNK